MEDRLALHSTDGDDLVAFEQQCIRMERGCYSAADDREQGTAVGDVEVLGRSADRRRAGLQMCLDELQLTLTKRRQVKQLVDGDVLLDRAKDHPGWD